MTTRGYDLIKGFEGLCLHSYQYITFLSYVALNGALFKYKFLKGMLVEFGPSVTAASDTLTELLLREEKQLQMHRLMKCLPMKWIKNRHQRWTGL